MRNARKVPISKEKLAQYTLNRRRKIQEIRQTRKDEIRNGDTGSRRLAFLANIISASGLTLKDAAIQAGIPPATLTTALNMTDNMFLETLKKVLAGMGIDCQVEIRSKNATSARRKRSADIYEFEGTFALPNGTASKPVMIQKIRDVRPDAELRFLADFFEETGLRLTEILRITGISQTAMYNMIETDRIKVGTICDIAEALDAKVIWKLNKKND